MRLLSACAAAIVLFALAAGCGSNSKDDSNDLAAKSPSEILNLTVKALQRVKTVHFESTDRSSGIVKADVGLPDQLRLTLNDKHSSFSTVVTGGSAYLKADATYWRQNGMARLAHVLADRWLKIPYAYVKDFTTALDPKTIRRCLLIEHGSLVKGGTATVGGRPAVILIDKGDRPGSTPSKLYVSAKGEPLPLRLLTTGKQRRPEHKRPECGDDSPSEPGEDTVLSRYNEPLHVPAPQGAVDLSSVQTDDPS
jgi:hypothetical protein